MNRFPEAASEDPLGGPERNFQIFEPLDFVAEVTQHVPGPGDHLIRYHGCYSNKSRGLRAKAEGERASAAKVEESAETVSVLGPGGKAARKRWAALIKQVYETDPLICPKCGGEMKIIKHWGLWEEEPARARPSIRSVTSPGSGSDAKNRCHHEEPDTRA